MKLLLTAFEAFNGRPTNIAQLAVSYVTLNNSQIEVNKNIYLLPFFFFSIYKFIYRKRKTRCYNIMW